MEQNECFFWLRKTGRLNKIRANPEPITIELKAITAENKKDVKSVENTYGFLSKF